MSLPEGYLRYPHRRRGMDHDRYEWSIAPRRAPIAWPNGARVALLVVPALEWFPLDMSGEPFLAPGGLDRPYPDYWNYTLRDYGNRVGFFRIARVMDSLGLTASVAMNAALAERHPFLVDYVNERGWEIIAHGVDMGHLHHGGLAEAAETALVHEAVSTLRRLSGAAVTGWLSPGKSESYRTLDLVAGEGIEYVCDWVNDDLPYPIGTAHGTIYSMPHPYELDDNVILHDFHQTEDQLLEQVKDQFDTLYAEAKEGGGRLLGLSLHPWVIGQPFRIATLESALGYVIGHDGVWNATAAEILAAWRSAAPV